ncbi:MAG TPA: hypothetical protein DCQ58_11895 [Saprospirales bacterium]|nr:hypothetical protein [Saprospirales bacterium]
MKTYDQELVVYDRLTVKWNFCYGNHQISSTISRSCIDQKFNFPGFLDYPIFKFQICSFPNYLFIKLTIFQIYLYFCMLAGIQETKSISFAIPIYG